MMYQRPTIKMKKSAFEKLPLREDAHEIYVHDAKYRSHGTNDVFIWVAYEDTTEAAGEWHRAPVELID